MNAAAEMIRSCRASSNAAIAAKDAAAVVAFMTEHVTVSVEGGPILVGRKANEQAFAEQMAERGLRGYVRTPSEVTIAADGSSATERGTWVGSWQVGLRTERQRGRYAADWERSGDAWLIASERFVVLRTI